jgi:hypothetical protein
LPNTCTKAAGSSSKAGNKQSGGKKYRTYVYADKIEFLGEPQRDGNLQKTELTLDQSHS